MDNHLSEHPILRRRLSLAVLAAWVMCPGVAVADDKAAPAAAPAALEDDAPSVTEARQAFVRGAELIKAAQWADALSAFERSAKLRAHAVTSYNIGVCHRAMGQYTRSRKAFALALAQDQAAGGGQLSEALVAEAKGFQQEIEHLLVKVSIRLEPANAAIAVDGRPLEPEAGSGDRPTLVAGVRPPGPGQPPPRPSFEVVMDPGAHVIALSRKGFADALVNRTFSPSSVNELVLKLDRLPAKLHVEASEKGATVSVDGVDVGLAPVELQRPEGTYAVAVRKKGFADYEGRVVARSGEDVDLRAKLTATKPALTERWWFWAGAGTVVAGAAVTTYVLTRPDPERPPLNGGGLGWTLKLR